MVDLKELYKNCEKSSCFGCTILDKPRPFHCELDYGILKEADLLILVDSYKYDGERRLSYLTEDEKLIFDAHVIPLLKDIRWQISTSVKCLNIREADMPASNMDICRQYLWETIERIKPKVIIPMGNLSLKMVMKKSGITDKRGRFYNFESPLGHISLVCPTFHPSLVSMEPKRVPLFKQDIISAINKGIHKNVQTPKLNFLIISSEDELEDWILGEGLDVTTQPIAIDVETEGLNFLTDKILTIAIAYKNIDGDSGQLVIPLHHKDAPLMDKERLRYLINKITTNKNNKKVLQEAKFDIKNLLNEGIELYNVWDTKIMAHLEDENQPKKLIDLVKRFFPEELNPL